MSISPPAPAPPTSPVVIPTPTNSNSPQQKLKSLLLGSVKRVVHNVPSATPTKETTPPAPEMCWNGQRSRGEAAKIAREDVKDREERRRRS